MRQRHQELVVWRTGAGKCCCALRCGERPLGLVSGLVAATGAEVALAMLQTKVFDFPRRRTGACAAAADGSGACGLAAGWAASVKRKALFRQFSQ